MAVPRIRIRMYRVGFGDCFLVSLPQAAGTAHLLVDCGVHSKGNIGTMDDVVADIEKETNGHLHAVIATHEHQDHISGFASCSPRFEKMRVDETWLPWTSDPKDAQARRLRRKQQALASTLTSALKGLAGRDAAAAHAMAMNAVGNARAMEVLRGGFANQPRVRYLDAGHRMTKAAGIPGLEVQVLGPPRSEEELARMDPPKAQRYLHVDGGRVKANAAEGTAPFTSRWRVGKRERVEPSLTETERDRLRDATDVDAGALAFALDKAVNNTSLVLLMRYGGRAMLFPGDAQWGSWESWLSREDAAEILDGVDVIKISHHGSHNGTPRGAVEKLSGFYALASTQSTPWASIPRLPLLKALEERDGRIVRSDWIPVGRKAHVRPPWKKPPAGISQGAFWFDLNLGHKL